MKPDASHIRQIKVVSNTHWDREFRWSFEKTRRRLLTMMDVVLEILEQDSRFRSFTIDGHIIMVDDYLEMRPERREIVERFIREGRLVAGPWYTLPEQFSLTGEALVRNFQFGRERMRAYGSPDRTVAYTPASWGQTGQMPQIFQGFRLSRAMFYRGISHDECDAEFVWEAPDGSRVLASRFALYARYNWYCKVHRAVTQGKPFEKDKPFERDYPWGKRPEVPVRPADGLSEAEPSYDLKDPVIEYDKSLLKAAIEDIVETEGPHFTTEVFLGMNGMDISVAHPLEAQVVEDAREVLGDRFEIQQSNLEEYWDELEKHLDVSSLAVLRGERRSHLSEGMWTFLFPATISARVPLKVMDFNASLALEKVAEPLASMAWSSGGDYPARYLHRGWGFLLANHTHDANGGCAPDIVCEDIAWRYRKASDIADIVAEDSMTHVARNLSPEGVPPSAVQLIVFNSLPCERDVVARVDLELPRSMKAKAARLVSRSQPEVPRQPIRSEKSSCFVDSIWDVPTILDTNRLEFYAAFQALPPMGYRVYRVEAETKELRSPASVVTGPDTMENEFLRVTVNSNGTIAVIDKESMSIYDNLNYLTDQGEAGNAWKHAAPRFDRVYSSLGASARVAVAESGPLVGVITAEFDFPVPAEGIGNQGRSEDLVSLPIRVEYRLETGSRTVKVKIRVDNRAKDHWLRTNFPTNLETDVSYADSHFDVVERPIPVPDSTGWAEKFEPTHPLRTFVGLGDGGEGLALFPRGLFEYEAIDDAERTLALTLLRCCRIKLAVSEEKQTELPDQGIQVPGVHTLEYAVHVHRGTWREAGLLARAAETYTPVRAVASGCGKGNLPHESSLFALRNANLQVTAVKQSDSGDALTVRFFNALEAAEEAVLEFPRKINRVERVSLSEETEETLDSENGTVRFIVGAKKIVTLKIRFA